MKKIDNIMGPLTTLSELNLETKMDCDLRDSALCQKDVRIAVEILSNQLECKMTSVEKIQILGQLGFYQRILGDFEKAETSFTDAIKLTGDDPNLITCKIANLIRLGHVRHWQERYSEAHEIFDGCISQIDANDQLKTYLDFAFQHKGKCYFDEQQYEKALSYFYKAILLRNNKSESNLTDSTLQAIEETKRRWLPQVNKSETRLLLESKSMPSFVKSVVNIRAQSNSARSNCINVALNFHSKGKFRLEPYRPMELLTFLIDKTDQVESEDNFRFGDLVVWWNRNASKWVGQKIQFNEMKMDDPEFPYGLIFDHVAVRVTPLIVFNKPNPSPLSKYRFDYLETASYPSKLGRGHEMTFHRLKF